MYSNDKVIQYLLASLKAYGIKDIVASPGMQNSAFNASIQSDDDFNCISVVDERSAAYVAVGMADESERPVVITCTGATASRNYMPALTEAYYRKVPIIALTFLHLDSEFNLAPQYLDRTISPNDIKVLSITLNPFSTDAQKWKMFADLHAALTTAVRGKGPVHIQVINEDNYGFDAAALPTDFHPIKLRQMPDRDLADYMAGKKVGVFVGSHKQFSTHEQQKLSDFATSWNACVFCDHTSNYHGKNKIMTAMFADGIISDNRPDIMIDIGGITGEYSSPKLFHGAEIWRVQDNGKYANRWAWATTVFDCPESEFFQILTNKKHTTVNYFDQVQSLIGAVSIPQLPLCNAMICQKLAENLPQNCTLHLGILNSLRNMNFFDLDASIQCSANVGGFGIDGSVSTLVGHSLAAPDKMHFGLMGDLAFFYDMNALGLRQIRNNVRLIVVNNSGGQEFRLNPTLTKPLGDKVDCLIAAAGHNAGGARGWAESCGFKYMHAHTPEQLNTQIKEFCQAESDKPILFEVFTTNIDENKGLDMMRAKVVPAPRKKKWFQK